jgi:hypothetical protein
MSVWKFAQIVAKTIFGQKLHNMYINSLLKKLPKVCKYVIAQ